jgi:hypothetical protein
VLICSPLDVCSYYPAKSAFGAVVIAFRSHIGRSEAKNTVVLLDGQLKRLNFEIPISPLREADLFRRPASDARSQSLLLAAGAEKGARSATNSGEADRGSFRVGRYPAFVPSRTFVCSGQNFEVAWKRWVMPRSSMPPVVYSVLMSNSL